MNLLWTVILLVNIITSILLLPHPLNYFYLAIRSIRWRDPRPVTYYSMDQLPSVTIQLPVYNESFIIKNTLHQLKKINYPSEKIYLQILDDSTDETSTIIDEYLPTLKTKFHDVQVVRRELRTGFKAGALQNGLKFIKTELIAIFDSDFKVNPDFLLRTVHFFKDNKKVAAVQTRWTHSNLNYSLFTRTMSIGLDCHFLVEKTGRYKINAFLSFNGTGGVWKKEIIEKCGGWLPRTLAEDLDLAYRVQLAGHDIVYLADVTNDQEIPPTLRCWIIQQSRWSKGFSQNLIIHSKEVVQNKYGKSKSQGLMHLSQYFVPVFILVNTTTGCLLPFFSEYTPSDFAILGITFSIVSSFAIIAYAMSIIRAKRPYWHILLIPLFLFWGAGLVIRMAVGAIIGLFTKGGTFIRTPKFNVSDINKNKITRTKIPLDRIFILEIIYFGILLAGTIQLFSYGLELVTMIIFYAFVMLSMLSMLLSEIIHALPRSR